MPFMKDSNEINFVNEDKLGMSDFNLPMLWGKVHARTHFKRFE